MKGSKEPRAKRLTGHHRDMMQAVIMHDVNLTMFIALDDIA